MNQTDALRLTTPRLLLRDLIVEDLPSVHAFRSDPEVTRFMDDLLPESVEQSRGWLEAVIDHNGRKPRQAYNLAIVHAATDQVIGWIGIGQSSRYPEPGELGVGYILHGDSW
jgi:[ribosomal protein S5]-alanine N-acetyltransferase